MQQKTGLRNASSVLRQRSIQRITKADGTWKEYDTTYTAFYSTNYTDDFIADGMDGATVSVKAYGDNDTFGCWSDDATVTKYGF